MLGRLERREFGAPKTIVNYLTNPLLKLKPNKGYVDWETTTTKAGLGGFKPRSGPSIDS